MVVYPFAIGFVSGLGSVSNENFEPAHNVYGPIDSNNHYAWYEENGGSNYSYYYAQNGATNPEYAFIEDGRTYDDSFGGFINSPNVNCQSLNFPHDSCFYQTHYYASQDYGNSTQVPYFGTSGDGAFSIKLGGYFMNEIEYNEAVDAFKFHYVDTSTSLNCNNYAFVNLTLQSSITFEYEGEEVTFDGFVQETTNKYTHFPVWNNFHETCHIGFTLEIDLDSFESLQLVELNDGFYNQTNTTISIDHITNTDNPTGLISNTELPFGGIDSFSFMTEYSGVDSTQANFFLKTGTLVLTVITFLLAIGSTPYWDPVMQSFRGRL